MSKHISRRTVLRGLGVTMALPWLDAMATHSAAAQVAGAAGTASAAAPVRMAMLFMPNGVNYRAWTPSGTGANYRLSATLAPLEKVRKDINILTGLALDNARAKGDGPGDHARSAAAFLTGAHPYKTSGSNIRLGISVDQFAAQQIGGNTRLPSLELGLDKGAMAGNCDSGYACAYVSNISWRSETQPMPKEIDPAAVFDRLFGSPDERAAAENRARRMRNRKSILDFVAEDAQSLQRQLGKSDQRKLDEFSSSVRDIERRIEAAKKFENEISPPSDFNRPEGIPGDVTGHMQLMFDLITLAFQMDITRVSTLMIGRDGSDRNYRFLGVNEGHHTVSHHAGNKDKAEQVRKIDEYHMQQFATFIQKLGAIKEGEKRLLDNCMLMIGSGLGDGNAHNHENLPIVIAGGGGGAIATGRHISYPRNTPLCNLYVSMLQAMGCKADRFGDSDGALKSLKA